jgi:hypothetical protein
VKKLLKPHRLRPLLLLHLPHLPRLLLLISLLPLPLHLRLLLLQTRTRSNLQSQSRKKPAQAGFFIHEHLKMFFARIPVR